LPDRRLARAPDGTRLASVRFSNCERPLHLRFVHDNCAAIDEHGVCRDAWIAVTTEGLPTRFLRIFDGGESLVTLLARYGFQDASGCVHHKSARAEYVPIGHRLATPVDVPPGLRDCVGMRQFHPKSGICWFAALCVCSFANPATRQLIVQRMDDALARLCGRCLYDHDSAVALRAELWRRYAVGDDIKDPPEMDGKNGALEFCSLCAQIGVPLIRCDVQNGELARLSPHVTDQRGRAHAITCDEAKPHLLIVRFTRGDHERYPALRSLRYGTNDYVLVSAYAGSGKCGHQIGMSTTGHGWRRWMIADADMHGKTCTSRIGPIFIHFAGEAWKAGWWAAWKTIVHVTKFGAGLRSFCSLSLHNIADTALDKYGSADAPGAVNIDFVYQTA
jgi:hypothetical protein